MGMMTLCWASGPMIPESDTLSRTGWTVGEDVEEFGDIIATNLDSELGDATGSVPVRETVG